MHLICPHCQICGLASPSPFSTHHPLLQSHACLHAWCTSLLPAKWSSYFTSVWDSATGPSPQKLLAFGALSLCGIIALLSAPRSHKSLEAEILRF